MTTHHLASVVLAGLTILVSARVASAQCPPNTKQTIAIDASNGAFSPDDERIRSRTNSKSTCLEIKIDNKNPYKYVYQLSIDEKAVTSDGIGTAILGLANLAGLPIGILAPKPAITPQFMLPNSGGRAPLDPWLVPASCPAALVTNAQLFLNSVRAQFIDAERSVEIWNSNREDAGRAVQALTNGTFGIARAVIRQDVDAGKLASATKDLVAKGSIAVELKQVDQLDALLDEVSAILVTTRAAAEEYLRLFPDCKSIGVLTARNLPLLDTKARRAEISKVKDFLGSAAVDINTAKAVSADPNSFASIHVFFPAAKNAYLTLTLSRKAASETVSQPVAARRYEYGDVDRFRVSVGFGYLRSSYDRFRYQAIGRPRAEGQVTTSVVTRVESATPSTTTATTTALGGSIQTIGEESRGRDSLMPVALVHVRAWKNVYASFGGGPSWTSGSHAVSLFTGASLLLKDSLLIGGGLGFPVDHILPDGFSVGSELPSAATAVPTRKRYGRAATLAITFRVK